MKDILLRQSNIGTRILITKERKQGKALLHLRRSLTPNPSPNGEGSENHYLQIKRAFRHIEERLFWIGRKALLHLRRAFPYLLSYTRTPRNPILLSLRNTSLKQYVFMSFCLKNISFCLKHLLLSTLLLYYYVFKICH